MPPEDRVILQVVAGHSKVLLAWGLRARASWRQAALTFLDPTSGGSKEGAERKGKLEIVEGSNPSDYRKWRPGPTFTCWRFKATISQSVGPQAAKIHPGRSRRSPGGFVHKKRFLQRVATSTSSAFFTTNIKNCSKSLCTEV